MERATEEALDLLASVLIFAILIALPVTLSLHFLTKDWAGFNHFVEKSANVTTAEIIPQERVRTRDDVILMLAVSDENAPNPRTVDINGTQINLNEAFFSNRLAFMMTALGAMPNNVPYTHTLYVGPAGPRYWKFVER